MKTLCLFLFTTSLLAGCQRPAADSAAAACIDPSKINPNGMCTMDYNPVCGCDGKTYGNPCAATNAGVKHYTTGPCAEKSSN